MISERGEHKKEITRNELEKLGGAGLRCSNQGRGPVSAELRGENTNHGPGERDSG